MRNAIPYSDAVSRMSEQCIQSLRGMQRRMPADIMREFNFIVEILEKEIPHELRKDGVVYTCPYCHEEQTIYPQDEICYRCATCGQKVYHLNET